MIILPRRLEVLLVCGLVTVFTLISLLAMTPVRADVGVRPILPGGSSIKPGEETPIQMAEESVVMNVRAASEADNALIQLNPEAYGLQFQPVWFSAIAEVQADFTMKNPTGDEATMIAWFPLASALDNLAWDELNPEEIVPRIESFQVTVEGVPLDYSVSELPNPKGTDRPLLPWASFPVIFPAGKDTLIHVSYMLPLHRSVKGSELALYYIFQTGAGWAGSIGQAELILNLPYPASAETLMGMSPGSLNLPYFISELQTGASLGGVLEGNQARWIWKDFEPGPQDDFAVWLIDLNKWQELQSARASVQANAENGRAWMDLALVYHSLSTTTYNQPGIFSTIYLPLAMEAYRKAAELLPDHPTPHTGLALLSLAPYMKAKNAPPEVIHFVEDELQIAREMEARSPSLAEGAGISSGMVEEALFTYFYNDATATAELAAWSTEWARGTAIAALLETTPAPSTPQLTLSSTPVPSTTPQPPPTNPPPPIKITGFEQRLEVILAASVVILVIVGYLVLKRMQKRAKK